MTFRRGVVSAIVVLALAAVWLGINSAYSKRANAQPSSAMPTWLHDATSQYAASTSVSAPTSMSWALTTLGTVANAVGSTTVSDGGTAARGGTSVVTPSSPAYVVVFEGDFVPLLSAPDGSLLPDDTWLMVVVDPQTRSFLGMIEGSGDPPTSDVIPGLAVPNQ
jgi:hypothetical protein